MWRFQQELPGLTRLIFLRRKSSFLQSLRHYQKCLASTTTTTTTATTAQAMASQIPDLVPDGQAQGQGRADYSTWSTPRLIARITELERQLHSQTVRFTSSPPTNIATETISTTLPSPPPAAPAARPDSKTIEQPLSKVSKPARSSSNEDITHTRAPGRPVKEVREIDPTKYHTRFIALKFAYLGQRYNGFEHANGNATPLPTIEEELWKALRKTRLILPPTTGAPGEDDLISNGPRVMRPYSISWEGCQYSKAGRTDRGVSAFGQVIGIRVRSARPKVQATKKLEGGEGSTENMEVDEEESVGKNWDDVADELPYIQMLNRVLPEDIRILAWCPNPPADFDARFSCRERRYKYFFTQPAFSPTPGASGFAQGPRNTKSREGWLDIDAMRKAAKYFEGVHDFRNFCKVDTSKQIENFERIIYHADIELVDSKVNMPSYVGKPGFQTFENGDYAETPAQVYSFTLHGSAFLWHQVRHMVGILFLVGQGLESPSIVPELLDISKSPRRPTYEMASDAPLVLWDCIFPDEKSGSREDAMEWLYAGDPRMSKTRMVKSGGKFGLGGVVDELWSVWRQRKMDEILASTLLDLAVSQGDQSIVHQETLPNVAKPNRGQRVFLGGNDGKLGGKYVPVMQKRKMEPVEVLNQRWLANKQRRKDKGPNPEI